MSPVSVIIVHNTMLYIIFQYGQEPVLIHQILIGFLSVTGKNMPVVNWNMVGPVRD